MRRFVLSICCLFLSPTLAFAMQLRKWGWESYFDKLDGSNYTVITLSADDAIKFPPRGDRKMIDGAIRIMCADSKFSVLIGANNQLIAGHSARLSYRIGQASPVRDLKWSVSVDNAYIGIWNRAEGIKFLKKLTQNPELFVRISDDSFGTTEMNFMTEGLDGAMKANSKICRWS
jgi:hypothetical protein